MKNIQGSDVMMYFLLFHHRLANKILLQITSSIIYFLYRIQYNILQIGHGILQNCVNEYLNNLRKKIFGQNYKYNLLHNIELHLC